MKGVFNIRVYGILIDQGNRVLLITEKHSARLITKFPGGGLDFGEGTRNCLIREFKEELNIDIQTGRHIYTTDFFQLSAFDPKQQIISIYYEVLFKNSHKIDLTVNEATMKFRWEKIESLNESMLSMPIDKLVLRMIRTS